MSGSRVLVTGVAGFLGSHVADHCLKLGYEVIGIDDLSGGFLNNVPAGVEFHQGSLLDVSVVESLWASKPIDIIYHLAAYAAEGLSPFIRRYNYQVNLMGSINLINQAINNGVGCFVFTSSIAVYGANQLPMTEDLTPIPEDPYGISKYAVELDLKAAYEMFGLPFIIFRPHNVYGERQNIADRYRNVIGIFMNQVMQGQPMTIFGDGTQTRAFSHVDDVAPVIACAPSVNAAYQQVFNVGADIPYTVLTIAEEVARAFDVEQAIDFLPSRHEVTHAFASHDKVRQYLPLPDAVPLSLGIQRMASWVKQQGPTLPTEFRNIEVRKNLPPSWLLASQTAK